MYKPHVQFVLSDTAQPSSRWLAYAASGINRQGTGSAGTCTFSSLLRRKPTADAFVIEHNLPLALEAGLFGTPLYLWLDDALWCVPGDSGHVRHLRHLWDGIQKHSRALAGIVTPSADLAIALRAMLPHVRVRHIPNYHDFAKPQMDVARRAVLGWGGSLHHLASWRKTAAIWSDVLPRAGLAVEIIGHPHVAAMLRDAGVDVIERPVLPFTDYLRAVAAWRAVLIPVSGEYDRYRSWIKALEACWCGVPWWGVGEHVGAVYYGVPGRVLDLQYATSVDGRKLHKWAEAQRIDHHVGEWLRFVLA